jgi:hypothetical protein
MPPFLVTLGSLRYAVLFVIAPEESSKTIEEPFICTSLVGEHVNVYVGRTFC